MVQETKQEQAETSTKDETPVDVEKDIRENMGAGKKHLICSDYPEAVACFQEACTLLSNKYGQMAEECSDAYYYYGVSLLELARLENGVLGNALKGVPEEDEEADEKEEQFEKGDIPADEREKLREEVEAAMATEDEDTQEEDEAEGEGKEKMETTEKESEDKPEAGKEKATEEAETKSEKESKPEKPEEPEKPKPEEKPCSSAQDPPEQESKEEEEDPEDISNMQLSWEMLELAKVLYKKREKNKVNSLMVAQCHLKLGELGLEVENHAQAIGDFLECLVIQKEHLSDTDRKLAETHYNLGLTYSFEKRFDNALEHYQNALSVLESRVELLTELIETKEEGKGEGEKENETIAECKEIGEIKDLIPDINSKIEDVLLAKKQNPGKLDGSPFRQAEGETTTGFGASSQDKPCSSIPVKKVAPSATKDSASDISHLVRRKRPSPDEDDKNTDNCDKDSKKAKQETNGAGDQAEAHSKESNGDKDATNGSSNGHSKTPEKADTKSDENSAEALKKKIAESGDAPVAMET